jgi:hypothetical protein
MDAGKRNILISLYSVAYANANGERTPGLSLYGTKWANVAAVSAREQEVAKSFAATVNCPTANGRCVIGPNPSPGTRARYPRCSAADWARPLARPAEDDGWQTRGREMWCQLHQRALSYAVDHAAETAWLEAFAARIGCGTCREHWRELVATTPPDLATAEGYFAWTVAAHNAVSRRLGKREWSVDDARTIHSAGVTVEKLIMLPHPSLDARAA